MPVFKSQLIEIISVGVAVTGNTAQKIQFQDQPYLRNKKIYGIEIFTSSDCTLSPTGKTPISGAQMKQSFLTLYLDDMGQGQGAPIPGGRQGDKNVGEWIQLVPFCLMHRIQNNVIPATALPGAPGVQYFEPFVRQMFEMAGQTVYWEKCYINLSAPFANTTDISFLFNIYFK